MAHSHGWSTIPASFSLPAATMTLLCGPMATGKTSLLRAIVGVAETIDGATVTGETVVAGHHLTELDARDRAEWIGYVSQNPAAGFVGATVEAHVARVLEVRGTPRSLMAQRVSEILTVVGASHLRRRAVDSLSAGQIQRVALAAALVRTPHVLICDEPTALLDPQGAAEILGLLHRLTREFGMTVLIADHQVGRYTSVDNVLYLDEQSLRTGPPSEVLADTVCEPVTLSLSRMWGTHPAITLSDARTSLGPILEKSHPTPPPAHVPTQNNTQEQTTSTPRVPGEQGTTMLAVKQVTINYQERTTAGEIEHITAVQDATLHATGGERIALMGANGAGKSSLLWALRDQRHVSRGTVTWNAEHTSVPGRRVTSRTGRRFTWRRKTHQQRSHAVDLRWVPADPDEALIAQTVEEECSMADAEWALPPGTTADLVSRFLPHIDVSAHPRSLSAGNKHLVALAVLCGGSPHAVALDEPTRSLDARGTAVLEEFLLGLANDGCVVVFASHDVDSIARCATRVVWLDRGEIIADLPPRDLFLSSRFVRPLVTGLCAPVPVITVEEATTTLRNSVLHQESNL
ncbi:ATP-binding cassette domain-containing protein [Jonesia quinghaiensis]|uniref:ATP-binding cassette domain-containing protein n=1 Tax=Jonesia quinghaiensis TaxID=262806 RepID=UPI0004094437|nr:ATP-binding cassette domain-containing protein [Jonesia quinghaiensis]